VDIWGRRFVLLFGCVSMSFSWLGAATCVYSGGLDEGRAEIYFPSYIMRFIFGAFLCLFSFSYAFSVGVVSWVVPAELFPLRARGKASSLTTACHAASALLSAFLLKVWLATGYDAAVGMMGFSIISISIAFFAYATMPETKGLMLEDMEELFSFESTATGASGASGARGASGASGDNRGDNRGDNSGDKRGCGSGDKSREQSRDESVDM
jgi:MFS family permease